MSALRLLSSTVLLALCGCVGPADDKVTDRDADADTDADSDADTDTDTDTDTDGPPILLVVLADDLGDNFLWAMDTVTERLVPESVRFTRAYSTVPLCCPVRSSLMLGGYYVKDTGVYNNDGANGGFGRFDDTATLATRLQEAGYATALVGKYLNGYEDPGVAGYVPPGWDLFLVPTEGGDFTDAEIVRGSSTPAMPGVGSFEDTDGEHLTGWLFDEALAFLDAHPDDPAFVLLTPQSPHIYGTPAAEDLGSWDGYAPRPPSFAEEDVADKPGWIRRTEVEERDYDRWDAETRLMMENLESLDRGMGALLDGIEARGLTERTTLVFMGDNGHLHGEHRLVAKSVAYEESVRVPLLVRAPGTAPREDARLVAMNLDVPATILDLAGVPPLGEGISLVEALADEEAPLRDHVFLETAVGAWKVWAGVVTERWKYVEWGTGETELYDLAADPYEMESLHAAPPDEADVETFAAWVAEHRALSGTRAQVPTGRVGEAYSERLEAWGGVAPLTWTITEGALPDGLTLSPDGVVAGTPTAHGSFPVEVRVTDSGASAVTGEPQSFAVSFNWVIAEEGALAPPSARAAWEGEDVAFVVPARPGSRVRVRVHHDETRDTPAIREADGVVGADGLARVRVAGLDPARAWWWSYVVEGVDLDGGVVPPR